MSKIQTALSLLKTPTRLIKPLALNGCLKWIPDLPFLKLVYWAEFGKKLNLKNPISYNEKLQWLKLYDRKPIYTKLVDKYAVKGYVADIIGKEHIIPTLGVWEEFDDIDFDKLPNQFVMKCTHDSGGLVICRDKSKLDIKEARKKIEKCLKKDFYRILREWPYKNVPKRIIAEEFIIDSTLDENKPLTDYKFYCFDGKVEMMMIATDRFTDQMKFDFFDREFNWIEMTWGHPNSKEKPPKPELFDEMILIAEKLSKNIPHVRVDLYLSNHHIYFGEMTFFHAGGLTPINPYEIDVWLGSKLKLPK